VNTFTCTHIFYKSFKNNTMGAREIGWSQTDILLWQLQQQVKKNAQTSVATFPTTSTTTTAHP
jgi:hypothetical protein